MFVKVGRSTTALVWATPVKITDLLNHLDVFRGHLATRDTLLLCHRYAKGDTNNHIAKLPKELVDLIANAAFDNSLEALPSSSSSSDWTRRYCCFEGSCRPSDHIDGVEREKKMRQAQMTVYQDHPEFLQEDGHLSLFYDQEFQILFDECDRICSQDYDETLQNSFRQDGWKMLLDRDEDGEIASYRELLHIHFGLEFFTMHDNLDESMGEYLLRTDPRFPDDLIPVRATLCYLALPFKATTNHTLINTGSGNSGYGPGTFGNSMLIDQSSLYLTDSHKKRFALCMASLKLRVSVHPSQLGQSLSAYHIDKDTTPLPSRTPKAKRAAANSKRDAAFQASIRELENRVWPQLLLLAKGDYDSEGVGYRD